MCSMLAVAIGAQGAATIMQGAAAKQRGEAAKKQDYLSAEVSDRAAADATKRGELKDEQVAMRGSAVVAEQTVIQSGTGADLTIGAPKATRAATEAVSDVDRAVVRRNAALEAYGLRSRAGGQRQQGQYAEAEGNAAMWGTFLGGLGRIGAEAGRYAADQGGGASDAEPTADEIREMEH